MNFQELVQPITHSKELNPKLWDGNKLRVDVRNKLLQIAKHFEDYLNYPDLKILDITVSGSNAGYNYNEFSDIDLHLIVPEANKHTELFSAKKNQYNFTYDIQINGIDVELYVQDAEQEHHSAGIYSVLHNKWLSQPNPTPPKVTSSEVKSKARNYAGIINQALRSSDVKKCQNAWEEIRRLRQAGLETGGEQSVENLAFKLLRARGQVDKLRKYITRLTSAELSLGEEYEN